MHPGPTTPGVPTHLARVLLDQWSRPLPQVLAHKLPKLDLAQEAYALAVLAPTGGQPSSSSQRTHLQAGGCGRWRRGGGKGLVA